ncbi:MAG TPA: HAMP domain-containing sensor histidine kinase [Pirellulales bacterium]|jgi:signal transduction histidine kinase|nr:HAMP domain-containing sensor histidine kinase [Pirellulales bacterium]
MRRTSLGWPITLAAVMIVLLVTLIIGWVLLAVAASQYANYWWAVLALGTTFLVLVLVGVVLYLWISIKEIGLNQRQSNFIDSVTHELKSPIASLKLYVQTLSRRNVTEAQAAEFRQFMLDDLARLDTLVNHLLEAAKLEHKPDDANIADIELSGVLRDVARTVAQRYELPEERIRLSLVPAMVRAQPMDVEIVFRNLVDNAIKYSGPAAEVAVDSWLDGHGRVITRVADNGPGIPAKLRRKIFGRFVRLGSELERSQTGTGLGLYIVKGLVRRMHGRVVVRSRLTRLGTIFEVELPCTTIVGVEPTEAPQPPSPVPDPVSR